MNTPDPVVPKAASPARPLDPQERCLVRARLSTRHLAALLLARPINAETYRALQEYLDTEAAPALEAYEALAARSPELLQARIQEILNAPRGSLLVEDPFEDDQPGGQA